MNAENATAPVSFESFTAHSLIEIAATQKGVRKHEKAVYSEPIKEYTLDARLLAILAAKGIKQHPRTDGIFTLVDENFQSESDASNYWNFKYSENDARKFDLRMSLCVSLAISQNDRGIVLLPFAHGTFSSPVNLLVNFRMFKTLTESDDDAPLIAKELAASEGSVIISWTEIGLGGIRPLDGLFKEFIAGNNNIDLLARRMEVFSPNPYPGHGHESASKLYIPEPAQPKLFATWRNQLKAHCDGLRQ